MLARYYFFLLVWRYFPRCKQLMTCRHAIHHVPSPPSPPLPLLPLSLPLHFHPTPSPSPSSLIPQPSLLYLLSPLSLLHLPFSPSSIFPPLSYHLFSPSHAAVPPLFPPHLSSFTSLPPSLLYPKTVTHTYKHTSKQQ